jgi:hypothetical protein
MTFENDISDTKALCKNALISHKISILMFDFDAMTNLNLALKKIHATNIDIEELCKAHAWRA